MSNKNRFSKNLNNNFLFPKNSIQKKKQYKDFHIESDNSDYDLVINESRTILEKTCKSLKNSYLSTIVDYNSFADLCFLVNIYRKYPNVNEEILEVCLSFLDFSAELLLDTIQVIFDIYEIEIPESLLEVVKSLSIILDYEL